MVIVTVERDSGGRFAVLSATGHADWDSAGSDVVCAAVSAILQAAWLGLERVAGVAVKGTKSEGNLVLRWPEGARAQGALMAIVGTAEVAIERIAEQFPDHVRLARETEPPLPKQGRP
jgi:uncharacterized protein